MKQKQDKLIVTLSEENRQLHKEIDNLRNFIKRNLSCTFFPYCGENQAFNGIIRYLTVLYGGNVDEKKVVIVTQSSIHKNAYFGRYAVDLDNKDQDNYFVAENEKNSWIKYDFVDRKVRPTSYSIRSRPKGTFDGQHLKSWVIEGSNNDKNDWKILDERNEKCLVGVDKQDTFDIQNILGPNESFKYLRLRSTGHDSSGSDYLIFSALEYFGYLIYDNMNF